MACETSVKMSYFIPDGRKTSRKSDLTNPSADHFPKLVYKYWKQSTLQLASILKGAD